MGNLCSGLETLTISEVDRRPCAYVKYKDRVEYEEFKLMFEHEQVDNERKNPGDFNLDEMR